MMNKNIISDIQLNIGESLSDYLMDEFKIVYLNNNTNEKNTDEKLNELDMLEEALNNAISDSDMYMRVIQNILFYVVGSDNISKDIKKLVVNKINDIDDYYIDMCEKDYCIE